MPESGSFITVCLICSRKQYNIASRTVYTFATGLAYPYGLALDGAGLCARPRRAGSFLSQILLPFL